MNQLTKLFSGLSTKQMVSIGIAAVVTVGGLVGLSRWNKERDFRPLYTSMAPEDAAAVVQKLKESGIEYRLQDNGGSVLAPSASLGEARLALAASGLPKTGRIGFELFDRTNFGATEFVEHINYRRALEGELERTVMSLAEVEQARVHLTLPKESIFLEKQQPAKASVVLKMHPGAQLSQPNVLAVANLVAGAVEGLTPELVSIVDVNGALLNRARNAAGGESQMSAESLEVRQQIEHDLVSKMQATLEPLLGPERFRVGASVDYDLSSSEQQEETFDPTKSVMVSSQKTEDVTERSGGGGVPGTASNLPNPPASHTAGSGSSRRTENVSYESSRVVRQTHTPQGVVRRMSLSVLVDNDVRWEGQGAERRRVLNPPAPEVLKTIRDLVAAATGLNAERGDLLTVESLPFDATLNAEPLQPAIPGSQNQRTAPGWPEPLQKYRNYIIYGAAGLLTLIVLAVVGKIFFRRSKRAPAVDAHRELPVGGSQMVEAGMRTNPALEAYSGSTGNGHGDLADRVRQLAQGDMKTTASVVRLWLQEREGQSA